MKKFLSRLIFVFLLIFFVFAAVLQAFPEDVNKELDRIFGDGKTEFFLTINTLLKNHFRKSALSREDLDRITDGKENIPFLFERVMIIAYQRDAPVYSGWIQKGDKTSLDKFRLRFTALAKDYAARFVGSLFRKTRFAEFSMKLPHNKGKSTLDLVLQTLGFNVNNDLPDIPQEEQFQNSIDPDQSTQWSIDAVNVRKCWPETTGAGVIVAVTDSGIDPYNALFKDKTVPGFNFLKRTTPPWSDENPPMIDYGLHGTGVSSALLAIAPGCKIMPVRTADSDTMNDPPFDYWLWEWSAAGIYYAVNHGAHIISNSAALLAAEPVIAEAVRYAYRHNVVICNSAGNMPRVFLGLRPEEMLYKAFDTEVLLIGGAEKRDSAIRPWAFSVPGPYVDVVAPSMDVYVFVPVYMKELKNMYVAGTSLSAPIAAGVVALMRSAAPPQRELLDKPGAYVKIVSDCLKETARLDILGMIEPNEAAGFGLIDAFFAVDKIKKRIKSGK